MTPIGSAIRMDVGASPITENDDFTRRSKLVVMLVIGLRAANYIKLVSHGYVLGYKVSFRDEFRWYLGTSGRICRAMWIFHVPRRCVDRAIERPQFESV
jgi:hypothetical protein